MYPTAYQNTIKLKIMKELAKCKYSHMYPLHETSSPQYVASRGAVHRAKNILLQLGAIRLVKEEKHPGRNKKIYTLTVAGVIEILSFPLIYDLIDVVAENYADMFPLIFGKWQFFKKEGKEDLAVTRLFQTRLLCENYLPFYFTNLLSPAVRKKLDKWERIPLELNLTLSSLLSNPFLDDLKYDFTKLFLAQEILYGPVHKPAHLDNFKIWLNMLYKDPDLKAFLDKLFRQKESLMKYELRNLLLLKDWWKKKSKHIQVDA